MFIDGLGIKNGHKIRKSDRKRIPIIMKADELNATVKDDIAIHVCSDLIC